MSRRNPATGLEGAPDIMLLTMAGLMVAVVWLAAHAQERTLPEVTPPEASALPEAAELPPTVVRLRSDGDRWTVWVDDAPLAGGIEALPTALADRDATAVTLSAERATPWEQVLGAMQAVSARGVEVSVAAEPAP